MPNESNVSIYRNQIVGNINKNFSRILENESGISLIKNGSNISKPVVHGLYGNRLLILNNGIIQAGQQWGNDHAPEIDPLSADKITVIKGAAVLEYGGGSLGSIILVEPKRIVNEPHLHGQVNSAFESNGRGYNLNARIEKYTPFLAWRINGTLKKYGDRNSPDYFLTNTGFAEANFSLQLEKSWKNTVFLEIYGSTFNSRLGVLRGAHIGNLSDLKEALSRDVPFFTESDFSYQINAPKQHVSHHFANTKVKYLISDNKILEVVTAFQVNNRKEFDVRKSGRTDLPALSLLQYTFNAELKYTHFLQNNFKLTIGNQNILTDNDNNSETGILPLIPDYISSKNGVFTVLSKTINKILLQYGARYDFENQNVADISGSLPREIIRYNNKFHNITSALIVNYEIKKTQSIRFSSGFAMRNPAINELYSQGLHQGVSGIEEGSEHLKTETSFKNIFEYNWLPHQNFSLGVLGYSQYFNNYIYLNPQDEFRLTIRGAFPVFKYEQTNATIQGLDLMANYTFKNMMNGMIKYSYLRGYDLSNDRPLIFMPPNSIFGNIKYRINKSFKSNDLELNGLEFEINNRFVFKQNHILNSQDFALPPPAYNLLGLRASSNINLKSNNFRIFVDIDNVLNVRYRNYLNRLRYFANENGISLTLGLNYTF